MVEPDYVREIFSKYGSIKSVKIINSNKTSKSGMSRKAEAVRDRALRGTSGSSGAGGGALDPGAEGGCEGVPVGRGGEQETEQGEDEEDLRRRAPPHRQQW